MGKSRCLRMMLVMVIAGLSAFAGKSESTVETDPKLALYVGQNMASSLVWEQGRNMNVEQQRKTQDSILVKTTTLLSIKELTLVTLENVEGFGFESGLYKQMCSHCVGIATASYQLIAVMNDFKVQFTLVMEVSRLVDNAKDLTRAFSNIVTNGRIRSPMVDDTGNNDGKNLLRRIDRVTMANKIVMDLGRIRHQLENLLMKSRYLTWHSAFRQIDPEGWMMMWGAKYSMESVIRNWKNFKHK